ncbi:MAG: Lauroyl/myristoyl acyltransferase involved in lipid A biosynthesis (Lauroyl/myristoyl acyltransferase), partial [uncultured Frankineae bacterium]
DGAPRARRGAGRRSAVGRGVRRRLGRGARAARGRGARAVPGGGRPRVAPRRSGRRPPAQQPVPGGSRPRPRRADPRGAALVRAVLVRGLPPPGDPALACRRGHEDRGGAPAAREHRCRPRHCHGPAAQRQLGPRRGLVRRHGGAVHDRRRAAAARVAVRPLRRLPRVAGHGGPAADGRVAPAVRRPRRAAPRRRDPVPAGRPGPVGTRRRRRLLRRDGADAGRPRVAGAAHRRDAAAGHAVLPAGRVAGRVAPRGAAHRRADDDAGDGRRLRRGHRSPPGRLAHAAAALARRPGRRRPAPGAAPV